MLYLIDSSIYIFRAWQALPASIVNRYGEQGNAVQGFAEMLAALLLEARPSHLCCAFDESLRQGERYRIYPQYKAGRPPAPEALRTQFQRCREVAAAFGIVAQGSARVEADDIIGLYAADARAAGMACCIVSGDKDLVQYVRENDWYYDPGRRAMNNYSDCEKRFRLRPDQLADMLALCGDVSDNIPGVPGIGAATAQRLLRKWDNLENLFDHLGDVPDMQFRGAQQVARQLAEHRDTVFLARRLTGLIADPDLPRDLDRLRWQPPEAARMFEALCRAGLSDTRAERMAQSLRRATDAAP